MTTRDIAFVTYYDEDRDVFSYAWLHRSNIQPFLDRAIVDDLPLVESGGIIGDEEARKLGAMSILTLVGSRPGFRNRLQITTATPIERPVLSPLPSPSLAERRQRIGGDADELANNDNFQHWHIDIMAVQGRDLTLGLSLDDVRTTITFGTTTRCSIENFGIANIVDAIAILEDGTQAYDEALVKLSSCKRLHRAMQPNWIVSVSSAVGVNALVECVDLSVQP